MNTEDKPLINRVANSKLHTINLELSYPKQEIFEFDIKDYLFKELILKEKDFRTSLKEHDWSQYDGAILLIFCSTDAIIPVWAFMLVAAYAKGAGATAFQGNKTTFLTAHYEKTIDGMDLSKFEGERIVIKGCSNKPVPASAYARLTADLQPFAQSIMYGEPCSTVPIFKRPRKI